MVPDTDEMSVVNAHLNDLPVKFSVCAFEGQDKCHGLTLLNIKSEDTMACCAQQIMYRMTKGIRFLL